MENIKTSFIKFLIKSGALKFGGFTLKSGKSSPFFINMGQISSGKELEFLGKCFARTLNDNFPETTSLFGPAYKGISLASVISTSYWLEYQKDLEVFFDRKEAKDHGEGGIFIGRTPGREDQVVVVDDVLTDGATKIEAMKSIAATFKVTPIGVMVAVDRSKPDVKPDFKVSSIVTLKDILAYLVETRDPHAQLMKNFMEAQ